MSEIVYPEESYAITGACFNVYKEMGCGFLERVYQECLAIEFETQGIPFAAECELELFYRGRTLKKKYTPDFICYDKIIVEVKATSSLTDGDRAQTLNYLHATHFRLGILVNFGHHPGLQHERIVL